MKVEDQDWGFVGPAYTANDPYQDRQVLVNYYLETDKTQGAKVPVAMLGSPGLIEVANVTTLAPPGGDNFVITDTGDFVNLETGDFVIWQ